MRNPGGRWERPVVRERDFADDVQQSSQNAGLSLQSAALSPDGKKAYGVMDNVSEVDLTTNSISRSLPNAEGTSFSVVTSSDGKKLYVGAGGRTITVYDANSFKPLKVLQIKTDSVGLDRVTF